MSIRVRFILVIGCLSLIATGAFAFLSYSFTINTALDEAQKKGDIVSAFLESSLAFYRTEQRPLIMDMVDKERFHPTLMSGFAISRGVWDEFKQKLPGYRFKQATVDPLYTPNKADIDEIRLITDFNENKSLERKSGIMEKDGEDFFYYAQPIEVKKGCLRCHGNPADAPEDQRNMYGTENGYNWVAGSVVAAYVTYVPVQNAIDDARNSAMTLFGYGVAGIFVLSLVIWFFFEKKVVLPVRALEKRASDISVGKRLDEKIETSSEDEIGKLAKALERMRISVVKLIERHSSK
ncbi:c-type heme family protein [Desulfosediminicola ganghwensis]|uniref:c-type heme family protein n=1 Tax=Desulfosediminicola ganghwensis TaxID=2569540 RepID=UPI00142ECDC5|nr:DUF3365 domain-containing protein [Desulfosediminicola ganghwensis]